ncbi:MAG TPA: glucuronate isomerase [Sphingomicrobium sp.]|nr:glucuronate isomerase [Sphingomicrobium sp.]
MKTPLILDPDRLFPAQPVIRQIARELHEGVEDLPIVSPHGHTDPAWFANNQPFANPAELLIIPDHYLLRMLYSQGIPLERLGIPRLDGGRPETDPRAIWRIFAENYALFRGTPSRLWLDWVFAKVFSIDVRLSNETADFYFDAIDDALKRSEFLPRALFDRFNIEVLATTESPLERLQHHEAIRRSGWSGRVITAYRPDPVMDPEYPDFAENLLRFGEITGEDVTSFEGYLRAHQERRSFFREAGATSTDHGHPTPFTADLPKAEREALYASIRHGGFSGDEAELFRGQMLTEMARMSLEDGMVMQIHPGVYRSHNPQLLRGFGRDKGADIPIPTEYVRNLKPVLDRFGSDPRLTIILFTLDESTYSRELAPLAGHYPAIRIGAPWWFHDSPEGMRRFREQVTETAGFSNTVGFIDDTRAFLSIPARHDVARRMDCTFLARLVAEHRLCKDEAHEVARLLAYDLTKRAYKL